MVPIQPRDATAFRNSGIAVKADKTISKIQEEQDTSKNVSTVHAATRGQQAYGTRQLVHYRRAGAMSVTGQLYETKLLTLLLLRFLQNKRRCDFYLGANITGAGALDDLCFKYKPANSDKSAIVFIQAKHKINIDKGKITMTDVKNYGGDFSVEKHFESYLMIRQRFSSKSNDVIFKGAYHDFLCFFVVYTPLKHDVECRKPLDQNDANHDVRDLIQTSNSGDIFQLDYKHAEFITKQLVEKNVSQLGKTFFEYIIKKENVRNIMDEKLIKMYHVVIAQNVIKVIDDAKDDARKERYRFRSDFFNDKEKLTTIFRQTLYDEAVNNMSLCATIVDHTLLLHNFFNESITAESISEIIGNVVKYDEKTNALVLLADKSKDHHNDLLKCVRVEASLIRNAISIKGRKLLEGFEFTLPVGFGNRDLTLKGNADKIEKRLNFVATNLIKLLECGNCLNGTNWVNVDESMVGPERLFARGVVEHDGGLGSALGNLLVYDNETDALKFNASSPLPEHANTLWNKLKQHHDENLLVTYRFKFHLDCFPKTSFQDLLYEEYLVKDFIGQYWLCTGQAKEDAVECIVKKDINKLLKNQIRRKSVLRTKSDAVFLMLHDKVQKWWMLPDAAEYLTESSTYLQDAITEVLGELLLSVLNHICVKNLRSSGIEFDEAVLKFLACDEVSTGIKLIVTDSITHTAVKMMQYYTQSQNYTFMDFNYVSSMLYSDFAQEVRNSNVETIIIICKVTGDVDSLCEELAQFIQDVPNMNITVITDEELSVALKQELTCTYYEMRDDKNGLTDLSPISKEKILNECKVVYQGEEVAVKTIIGDDSHHLITSYILQKLVKKEVIEIGKPLATQSYNSIKPFYIKRNVSRRERVPINKDFYDLYSDDEHFINKSHKVDTLKDLAQSIVVVTGPPGMGKSILLTHLSLETKKMYPNVWIARINLLDFTKQFHKWQQCNTAIDKVETLSFLCNAVLNLNDTSCEFVFVKNDYAVSLSTHSTSAIDLLQADLFMNYVNNGEVIFIFDGFDEICPLYEKEVIQLMKATATSASTSSSEDTMKKPKMWIASRSYNNVKHVIEREFGSSYSLEPLSAFDQKLYLEKYWKEHMKVTEFSYDQLQNVTAFMEYMKYFSITNEHMQPRRRLKPIHVPLHDVFIIAARYFQDEINNIPLSPALKTLTDPWRLDSSYLLLYQILGQVTRREYSRYAAVMSGSPLHTHIAAEYLQIEIQQKLLGKWDLDNNTFSLYKHFLETKLTKIRFEEKNRIDVSSPDSKLIHDREKAEFIDMHRMLGLYALFRDQVEMIMSTEEVCRVKCMIEEIKFASEKTGVIDCVVDDVPRFVHRTFAEYFAADYICEALKVAFVLQQLDRQETIWDFILSVVILNERTGVSSFIDFKLFNDESLKTSVIEEQTEIMVYSCLLTQTYKELDFADYYSEHGMGLDTRTALDCAVNSRLKATAMYLLNCFAKHMQGDGFKLFMELVKVNRLLWTALQFGYEDFIDRVFNIIRDIDESSLHDATKGERFEFSMFTKFSTFSNAAVIRAMKLGVGIMQNDTHSNIHVAVSEDGFGTFLCIRARLDAPPHCVNYFSGAIDLN